MKYYRNKPLLDKNLLNYTRIENKKHYWGYTDGFISFCYIFSNVTKKQSYKLFKMKFENKYNLINNSYFIGG